MGRFWMFIFCMKIDFFIDKQIFVGNYYRLECYFTVGRDLYPVFQDNLISGVTQFDLQIVKTFIRTMDIIKTKVVIQEESSQRTTELRRSETELLLLIPFKQIVLFIIDLKLFE